MVRCKLNIETDKTSWAPPNMTKCEIINMPDIDNITITTDNAADVVDLIQELVDGQLTGTGELDDSELESVVKKLSEVVNVSLVEPPVATEIMGIVADILLSDTDVAPLADMVLNLTDKMGSNMDFPEESVSVAAPLLALSMVNVRSGDFRGLTFAVSSTPSTLNPETFINQSYTTQPLPNTDATISLPVGCSHYLKPGQRNETRIQFHFFGTLELFQDLRISNNTDSNCKLNSFVVSASINDSHVSNLNESVVVTLKHQTEKKPQDTVQCIFWDFQENDGQGGWSSSGCVTESISPNWTRCLCDHLTHFAVLLSVSRDSISNKDNTVLTLITFIGSGISSIFLGVTLLTYITFGKLRRDYPAKILINLSAALLGLNLLILLNPWLSSFSCDGLSVATAAIQHYLVLASFTWMGLEAMHMYLALIKVFNIYISSYMLKFCAVGWGIPVVVVSLVLVIDMDAYGMVSMVEDTPQSGTFGTFYWLQDKNVFYMALVAPVLLILLGNISVFVMVLIQIRKITANKSSSNSRSAVQDLRAVASISVLLGLTWSMGFFSFGPGKVVLMYMFTICNSFQGFFVFLFHCLMKENVRKQWRIHLCCGRFRLYNCTEWSNRVMPAANRGKSNLVNSDSVVSDSTIARKVSDSSIESANQL
ncbi:adhesion G protein-coupled receptor G4a [Nelusetta ayraudi]|uniref:adhesion G protein-coupled receptor G4a n=1 Tax=Nelusetta ayraudi TaxID=303726 RepID=UPI003F71ECA5